MSVPTGLTPSDYPFNLGWIGAARLLVLHGEGFGSQQPRIRELLHSIASVGVAPWVLPEFVG